MTREHNRRNAARGRYTPVHARSGRRRGAGRIQQCVKDVLDIASKTEDFAQAKKCIEQLFVVSKAQHRGHLAVAQRVRDQIDRGYDDAPVERSAVPRPGTRMVRSRTSAQRQI